MDISGRLVTIVVILFTIMYFSRLVEWGLTKTKSTIDNRNYMVRQTSRTQAANLLALIRNDILILIEFLNANKHKYTDYEEYIQRLINRFEGTLIMELPKGSDLTSYSVGKGRKIVLCLRPKDNDNKLYAKNLLMYVALHEIAHIACPEYGHTPTFNFVFTFLVNISMQLGLYKNINSQPYDYCGITINNSLI